MHPLQSLAGLVRQLTTDWHDAADLTRAHRAQQARDEARMEEALVRQARAQHAAREANARLAEAADTARRDQGELRHPDDTTHPGW